MRALVDFCVHCAEGEAAPWEERHEVFRALDGGPLREFMASVFLRLHMAAAQSSGGTVRVAGVVSCACIDERGRAMADDDERMPVTVVIVARLADFVDGVQSQYDELRTEAALVALERRMPLGAPPLALTDGTLAAMRTQEELLAALLRTMRRPLATIGAALGNTSLAKKSDV